MSASTSLLTPALVLLAPLLLWVAGMVPASTANAHPGLMARLNQTAAWLAFLIAVIALVMHSHGTAHSWMLFSLALPGDLGDFSIGTYVNGVTLIMLVLVSFVGAIVSRFARNYLGGDPDQGRFYNWLTLTLASILTLIVSGNLLMFSLAWIATSLCLHQLLMFYRNRRAAVLAAHKKFIASRIGDASLLIAIFLIGSTLHTLEFEAIYARMANYSEPLPAALQWASWLIVLSAMLKSAQFPFHGWLIQVMEAPTPVSALLHAGIVNAGAFLIIRMSPIMSHADAAMTGLAVIGLVTLALASLVMLTQTSIKVSLAWSTTAQMGFMLLECALGLYSLAMLHLVAHSLYKAHAFLASGSGVDAFRAPAISFSGLIAARHWAFALGSSIALTLLVGAAFGVTPSGQPALLAAGAIVAVALSQLMLQAAQLGDERSLLLRVLGLSTLVCTAYFALHALFEHALEGSVYPLQDEGGALQTALATLIVGLFLGLLVLQHRLKFAAAPQHEALYMHLYNGLYIDVFITRILQRIWPAPATQPRT
jgi:NAD(P)H-quinone oxidoreductase subunit 5